MTASVIFDSSVLVAGLVAAHPSHAIVKPWLVAASVGRIVGAVSTHALAETWSVLTRLPMGTPITGDAAKRAIDRLRDHLRVLPLVEMDYDAALSRCAERGLRSGAVFDALHLIAAERARADAVVTLNGADFRRLQEVGFSPEVVVPPDDGRFAAAILSG